MELNQIRRSPLALAMALALTLPVASTVALAQEGETSEAEDARLDVVTVTGSRIKRAELEGPAPITVITSEDLEEQGFITVYDALNTLTQFTGSVQNELTQNGFTPNASFLNLRGLGPGYQLVLINGRRAADYPIPYNSQSNAVNLNAIPVAAIDRIEILAAGASAIYGSDAVAGVVNIIMKTNVDGDEVSLRLGTTTRGGGDSGRIQWVGGRTSENWTFTYAFEYLKRDEIFASEREFMDSYRDDPSVNPEDATAVSGLLLQDAFTGAYLWPGGGIEEVCGRFTEFETFAFNSDTLNRCYYYGYPATQVIRNADDNFAGYLYGTYYFENGMEAFAQFSVTAADATVSSSTQFWQSGLVYVPELETIVNTQRIFTPAEVGGIGAQSTEYSELAFDAVVGLRGTMFNGNFDWDATLSHGRYEIELDRPRLLANAVNDYFLGPYLGLDPILNGYPSYNLNLDRYLNPIDAATFRSLSTIVETDGESEVTQGSFVLSGDIFDLPAGPVGMAAVVEMATQEYSLRPDPRILPTYEGNDPIYNLTGTPGGGDRDRYALGTEFSVPVVDSVTVNLAARYDKYDDVTQVDDAITWQAGLEWRPVDSLLIRGTHGTSFRAPDMHYVFAGESGFFQTVLDEYRCRRDGLDPTAPPSADDACNGDNEYVYSVFGTRSGSTELEEEEGESTTIGFVWDITNDMSIEMDYYRITLEGGVSDIDTGFLLRNEADCRLGQTRDGQTVDIGSAECQYYLSLVDRLGIDDINDEEIDEFRSVPFNQARVETSGIDAKWRYRVDAAELGAFNFELAWTHVLKLEEQDFPGSPVRNTRDHPQYFNFRSRVNWTANWQYEDWSTTLYGYRWGSLPNWAETGRIHPYTIWNFNVEKRLTDNLTAGLFVNNVLDTLHPEDDTFNSYPFFWRAYSPIGREVFVQLDYRF